MTVGQSIQKAREDRGYTIKALSVETGISQSLIRYWENDKVTPTVTLLCCVADVLGTSLDKLIGRTSPDEMGEWLIDVDDVPYCSQCRARALYQSYGTATTHKYRRTKSPCCPNCGAKLKGDNL